MKNQKTKNLTKTMSGIKYKLIEQRQLMAKKAYGVLLGIIVVFGGYYFYGQWQDYSYMKTGLENGEKTVEFLRNLAKEERNKYEENKANFDSLSEVINEKIKAIFPPDEQLTAMTRQLDLIEYKLAETNELFQISNIDFQSVQEVDDYMILPIRMNIRSSENNFTRFLHLIENSGSLSDSMRIMDISAIRINFENSGSELSRSDIVNFAVQVNAYFQKTSG